MAGPRRIFLCVLCVSAALAGCVAERSPDEHRDGGVEKAEDRKRSLPSEGKPESDISRLIQQLGSDDWQTRPKAQEELIEMGKKLVQEYRQAKLQVASYKLQVDDPKTCNLKLITCNIKSFADALREASKSNDPEIKMRANLIRQHLYSLTQPKIAFVSDRDGNSEIYVMDAAGQNQTRLTENKADDESPAWSPDGKRIAFSSDRDGNWEIYVMDADGKNQTRLTENQAFDQWPVWGPDGTKITFASSRDGRGNIYVLDADGGNQTKTRLTENQATDNSPDWSPSFLSELSALFADEEKK